MLIQKFRYIFVIFVLLLGIFFALGKSRFLINPITRSIYLRYYSWQLSNDKNIDAQKFWEFRDFYSATNSVFNKENIKVGKPFLIFSNPSIQSLDFLLPSNSVVTKKFVIPNSAKIIVQSQNEIAYQDKNSFVVKFVKQIPEMEKVNGFFSYFGVDIKPYDGYLWYNETIIKI